MASTAMWWFALWMELIAVGWIVLDLTGSTFLVALAGFFRALPLLLVGLFSGVIIDHFGRRCAIIAAQTIYILTAAGISALFFSGRAEYWHLAAAAFIFGAVWSVDLPARRSLIPDLVGKEMTSDAVVWEGLGLNTARIFGMVCGGYTVKFSGAPGFYLVLAGVSLVSLTFLRRLPKETIPRETMPPTGSPWKHLRDGFRYAGNNPVILAVFLITVIASLFILPYLTMLPVIARNVLHLDASGLGLIGVGVALGAMPGIALVHFLKRRWPEGLIYSLGTMIFALALVFFATSSTFSFCFGALLAGGIGQSCFVLMQSSLILNAASDVMRSRAMGLIVVALGIGPLGQLQIGIVASRYGAPFAVQCSATIAVVAIIAVMLALPQVWRREIGLKA